MSAPDEAPGSEGLGKTLGRGAISGLAGTAVMTAFQRFVEMPLTNRGESYAPADLAYKLLPIKGRRGKARRRVNYATHFALGAGWGAARGVAGRAGLRGQKAVGAVFGTMWPGDVAIVTALKLDDPRRWSRKDLAIDVVDKFVLAEACGVIYDRLSPHARPS